MKKAIFYLLNKCLVKKDLNLIEKLTCNLVIARWREGKNIVINCENKTQALKLDNALWTYDSNAFIPHDLCNKKTSFFSPIELYWPECYITNTQKDMIINLLPTYSNFITSFNEIIDFVPIESYLKNLARIRYRAYKKIGFQLLINKLN